MNEISPVDTNKQVNAHYGHGSIMRQIEAALEFTGKDLALLEVDDLAPIDEFHTRGRESTVEVAEKMQSYVDNLVQARGSVALGMARKSLN